jgi:CheY-like chemotaxis protein
MDYYFVKSKDLSIYDSIFRKHFSHLSEEGIAKAELVRKDLQILIAENNILSQCIAKIIFKNLGFENVDFASNDLNLISQLNQKNYDIIFMDLTLPSSDAFDVAEVLRMKKYQMPIIAMTSTLTRDNIKHIEESKMDGYLTKPLNPNNIKKTLVKWFV